jgi:hypothetical protein
LHVDAFAGLLAPLAASTNTTEEFRENILSLDAFVAVAAPLKLEILRPGPTAGACAEALEAVLEPGSSRLEALVEPFGLAGFVDFTAVVLSALFLVAEELIGAADLLEFLNRLGVMACLSGWCFLASARKAFLISASVAFRDTPSTSYGSRISAPFDRPYIGRVSPVR